MKHPLNILFIVAALLLSSCDQNPPVSEAPPPQSSTSPPPTPVATPASTPTPTATPIGTPTPEPTPVVRLTPDGILLVIKPFSVATETGLHGFPVGREVRIVSEDESTYTVTDGVQTETAPKSSFTNDLDKAAALLEEMNQRDAHHRSAQQQAQKRILEQRAIHEKQRRVNVANTRLERIQKRLSELDVAIAAASKSLEEVYRAKARGGYIYDSYGNRIGARASSASGNEHQLTQNLQRWNTEKQALQAELRTLKQ